MFAVYDKAESAEEIARIGVEAGAEFNNATAMPLTSYVIDLQQWQAPKENASLASIVD